MRAVRKITSHWNESLNRADIFGIDEVGELYAWHYGDAVYAALPEPKDNWVDHGTHRTNVPTNRPRIIGFENIGWKRMPSHETVVIPEGLVRV